MPFPLRHTFSPLRRLVLVIGVLILLLVVPVSCSGPDGTELRFLDRVRNEFPEISATRAADDRLLRLGRGTCSPSSLSAADVEELRQIGIERSRFVVLATVLCPRR